MKPSIVSKEDPRLIRLSERVKALKRKINIDTVYEIILSGHSVYMQGIGLPHGCIKKCIEKALEEMVKEDKNDA